LNWSCIGCQLIIRVANDSDVVAMFDRSANCDIDSLAHFNFRNYALSITFR